MWVHPRKGRVTQANPLRKGHIILIDADGALIPYYRNANSIDDASEFRDVNGDGVVEEVGTIHFEKADVLHVLPVTHDQSPILNIALRQKGFNATEWAWCLAETGEPNVFSIELGPLDTDTRKLTPKTRYEWSKAENRYVGPPGGVKLPFMRSIG